MKLEIITNPATEVFIELVRNSSEQLFASPFINTLESGVIDKSGEVNYTWVG